MWPLPALHLRQASNSIDKGAKDRLIAKNIRQWTVEDFNKNPPELILVDVSSDKSYFSEAVGEFDYISFFGKSADFKQVWSEYRSVGYVRLDFFGGKLDRCFSVNLRHGSIDEATRRRLNILSDTNNCILNEKP